MSEDTVSGKSAELAEQVARRAEEGGFTVAVAESLTSGAVASALGAAPGASTWFRGGIVAYASSVKHELLRVPPGPVVSEQAVVAMAEGAAELLGADLSLGLTGVGGPDPQDGEPVGTVWLCVRTARHSQSTRKLIPGSPPEVVQRSVEEALGLLLHCAAGLRH